MKIYQGTTFFTYKQLEMKIRKMVAYLKSLGVCNGSKLLVCMEHNINGVAFLAAASVMGIQIYLNYNLETQTQKEINTFMSLIQGYSLVIFSEDKIKSSILSQSGTKIIELWKYEEAKCLQGDLRRVEPIKNFLVLFTSGSSGNPKVISISEETICERIKLVTQKLEFTETSNIFMSGLLSNTTGIIFSFGAFLHGSNLIIPENRNINDWISKMSQYSATHIMLRPAMMEQFVSQLLKRQIFLPSLHVIAYGAAAMSEKTTDDGRKILSCKWIQGYGLSETFGPFVWLDELDHIHQRYKKEKYCIGVSDGSLKVRVVPILNSIESGELEVSGHIMMNGYLDLASNSLSTVNTWFKTGDIVNVGPDGYLYIKGRISTTMLSENGHCIYPEEIEAVVRKVNGIADVFLGVASMANIPEIYGTILCVSSSLKKEKIINLILDVLKEELSKEKWPDWIFYSGTAFLMGSNEKILKQKVFETMTLLDLYKVKKE